MKREDFIRHIESIGFVKPDRANAADRWIRTLSSGKVTGFKISRVAVRYEVKVVHEATSYSPKKTDWVRVQSGYLKNIEIVDGKIVGLK
jgi:hypothetical protein